MTHFMIELSFVATGTLRLHSSSHQKYTRGWVIGLTWKIYSNNLPPLPQIFTLVFKRSNTVSTVAGNLTEELHRNYVVNLIW